MGMSVKYKAKGKKRRRVLIAVGRPKIRMNMVHVTMRDGREVAPVELDGLVPIDRDSNLIVEWWE